MGKKTQSEANKSMIYRMTKTGASLGVGALFFAVGGPLAALPASVGFRTFLDRYKSRSLLGARVLNRTDRLRAIREKTQLRMLGSEASSEALADEEVELLDEVSRDKAAKEENA